jgi:sulfate adenylyltransferase
MQAIARPHAGTLINLAVDANRAAELRRAARNWPSYDLTPRQLCDVELLACGAFSPLRGFMSRAEYESVCASMRLNDGTLWPIPVTLDVPAEVAARLGPGASLALRDPEGVMLAALRIEEVWSRDWRDEAAAVYGTVDRDHAGVAMLAARSACWLVGGRLEVLEAPVHYDFRALRLTPADLRAEFARRGWHRVVAFQTRNPMHRAHQELTCRSALDADAKLLLHPVVGMTRPGDVDHYTRVRCYQAILSTYPPDSVKLALLPLAMRMAGPREALWHAIIRKNYGCTHLIVGRDHAGPSCDSGRPFYGPYDAQDLLRAHQVELGIEMVPCHTMVYAPDLGRYLPEDELPRGTRVLSLSGSELRGLLLDGGDIPEWFTCPAVASELQRTYPPRRRQGFTVFFTGLSGAGKSTIANALVVRLLEIGGRAVTLLDGDIVRKELSSELGFSKPHRDINIRRIGFVASEITKNGGVAVCAPIAPYDNVRKDVRAMIGRAGGFVLVFLSTPIEVCEQRDRKGLYVKARAGLIPQFTGISDPYEPPDDAELVIDATNTTPDAAVEEILSHLESLGLLDATGREHTGAGSAIGRKTHRP